MRLHLVIFGLFLLLLSTASSVSAKAPKIVKNLESHIGEITFIKLPGNPQIGYKWRFNQQLSTGYNLVEVIPLGWIMAQKGSMFFQKEHVMNIALRAKAAGQADLTFVYSRRIGGRTLSKTVIVRILIKPRLAVR